MFHVEQWRCLGPGLFHVEQIILPIAEIWHWLISWLSVDPHRPGLCFKRLAKVSPRIVGIAWHRDRYRIPAADAFVRLTRQAAEREQVAARLELGSG